MKSGEEGFSLVEVLVAFVILTAAVIAGFQIFGDGLKRIGRAENRLDMVEDARGVLAAATSFKPGRHAVVSARGRNFQVVVSPVAGDPEAWALVRPHRVAIWSDAELLLDTVVMGPATP
jgi:Prokaryotic N-terminal methylation motif